MPALPGNNAPDLTKQLEFLEQYKDRLDERSIVIGHSMGGFLGMHFVAGLEKKIHKLICVAPIYNKQYEHVNWSHSSGWNIGLNSMKQRYHEHQIKKNTNDWQVFLSDNDSWIQLKEAKSYFDSINVRSTVLSNY
jgi:predicted alpha/beta hydrolase family esterase